MSLRRHARGPDGLWRRAGGPRGILLALLVVVALRVIQLVLVAALARPGEWVPDRLLIWDGGWFLNVATDGYPDGYTYDKSGTMVGNGYAFFPLFPLLIRAVAAVGFAPSDASLTVSGVAGLVAGAVIYLLGVALWSRRVGLILTMLVCAQPMAVSLAMGYTEGLFLALVAGTLLAAHQRIWWLAGLLGTGAALTRPTGTAVALALAVAALLLWRTARRGDPVLPGESLLTGNGAFSAGTAVAAGGTAGRAGTAGSAGRAGTAGAAVPARTQRAASWFADKGPISRREVVHAACAAAAALLAGPLFLVWVGWRVGEWDAWFKVQTAGWGSTFDGGLSVMVFLYDTLSGGIGMVEMVTAWLIIAALVLCVVATFDRVWPPLLVFGLTSLVLALGQAGYWHSKPRLLVPVLLLACVPVAHALAKAPARAAAALLVLWSAFGLWFGAYMITIWPFTI